MKKILITLALMATVNVLSAHEHVHEGGRHDATATPFIENQGQWAGNFRFKAEVGPLALFMENSGLTWSLLQPDFSEVLHEAGHRSDPSPMLRGHAWRVSFVGGSSSRFEPMERAAHGTNYFVGSDRLRWRSDVGSYGEVHQRGIWPGVDMRIYMDHGHFKYDLVLAKGADAVRIGLRYEGLDDIRLDEEGRLVLKTSVGEVVEAAPVAWYGDGSQEHVQCRYTLRNGVLGFELISADASRPIVIDPTLIAATLSGSTSTNYGHCATYDSEGNIYTGAISFSQGYPAGTGAFQSVYGGGGTDIAVSKLSPDGTTLIYATYVGGNSGEYPHSLMVDNDFNLWIYGTTNSSNYPVTPGVVGPTIGGLVDIVVTKVGPTGATLVGSTFIGGGANDGRNGLVGGGYEQYRGEIVVDNQGNAYIASCTESSNFPVSTDAFQPALAGAQDGVVFSLDPTLTQLRFSTHLGGSNDDMAYGLKVRQDGVVVVSGGTGSTNFPVTTGVLQPSNAGGNDAFVTMLAATGSSLVASTFWGTSSGNVAYFIELDNNENVYIYGVAQGGVPIEPSGTYGVAGGGNFLAEFTADLTSVVFTSCIGPGSVAPVAFLVDVCNNIYISGYQAGSGLPITSDALYTSGGFYIGVFQPHMAGLLYGTYYTGANHVDGGTSRFDKNGVIYQGVCTSGGLPLTPNAYGTTQSSWDIGVFKIDMEQAGVQANVSVSSSYGCVPATLTFNAQGNAPNYIWDMGDGSATLTGSSVTHTYTEAGLYTIMLIGWDSTSCNSSDTAYTTVNILDPAELLAQFTAVPISSCTGYGVEVTNSSVGGTSVAWTFGDGGTSSAQNPTHAYAGPGTYELTLTVTDGICNAQATATQTVVVPPATLPYNPATPVPICPEGTVNLDAGGGYDTYQWGTGDVSQIITVDGPGNYDILVTSGECIASAVITVVENALPAPLPDRQVCFEESVTLAPGVPVSSITWSTGSTEPSIPGVQGTYWFVAVDNNGCTFRDTVEVVRIAPTDGVNYIPNVFTPNGDGLNDEFKVEAPGLQQFSMQVFNRWGQKMYETSSVDRGWKGGLDNGSSLAPDGTYFYIITFKDVCSNEPEGTRTGHVTLLR
jgi:gliding motility-associated-like protein